VRLSIVVNSIGGVSVNVDRNESGVLATQPKAEILSAVDVLEKVVELG
jgi:hypothetical protein